MSTRELTPAERRTLDHRLDVERSAIAYAHRPDTLIYRDDVLTTRIAYLTIGCVSAWMERSGIIPTLAGYRVREF